MKKWMTVFVMIVASLAVSGQSAAVMDDILSSTGLTSSQAAYLVLVGSGQLADTATPEQGFRLLDQLGWAPWLKSPEDRVNEAEFAWLLAKAWRVTGGMLYTVFPGPRYAFREFQYRGWASPSHDPGEPLLGNVAIRMLGKVMDAQPRAPGSSS